MKFLTLFTFIIFYSAQANAIEATSQMGSMNPLLEIRAQIDTLQARLDTMNAILADAAACGDAGQNYTGIACVTPVELDPTLKVHGTKAMIAACAGDNTAQEYNTVTNTWQCKTLSN